MVKSSKVHDNQAVAKRRATTKRKQQFRMRILMQNLKQKVRQQVNKEIETIGIKEYIKKNDLDVDSDSVDVETQQKAITKEPVAAKKDYTLSIVIPASIIDNAQSFELKTYLVCQIARAAAIY
jgi:hypothetical protein